MSIFTEIRPLVPQVRAEGLEPTLLAEQGPKPCASASFATPAAKPSRYRPDDRRGHRGAVERAPIGSGNLVDEVADREHVMARRAEECVDDRPLIAGSISRPIRRGSSLSGIQQPVNPIVSHGMTRPSVNTTRSPRRLPTISATSTLVSTGTRWIAAVANFSTPYD